MKKIKIKRNQFRFDTDLQVNKKNIRSLENRAFIVTETIKKGKKLNK